MNHVREMLKPDYYDILALRAKEIQILFNIKNGIDRIYSSAFYKKYSTHKSISSFEKLDLKSEAESYRSYIKDLESKIEVFFNSNERVRKLSG